jgi:DNA polymerase-3 subunit alpha
LNPDRVSLPIDIDFDDEGRSSVMDYEKIRIKTSSANYRMVKWRPISDTARVLDLLV